MPPKKRAASANTTNAGKAKKVKSDEPDGVVEKEELVTKDNIMSKLKEADKNDERIRVTDKFVPSAEYYSARLTFSIVFLKLTSQSGIRTLKKCLTSKKVYDDYDCLLNQANIGFNKNKFYIIQILQGGPDFYCWYRWGRIGEPGENNGLEKFRTINDAIKAFEKKFKEKTSNNWKDRKNFVLKPGKYALIEIDTCTEDTKASVTNQEPESSTPSKLEPETQEMINLIFNSEMLNRALAIYKIDFKKMPLGKLSNEQINKGFEVLEEIKTELKSTTKQTSKVLEFSSKFYSIIPQNFGRQRPLPIDDEDKLKAKYEMLLALSDIVLAERITEQVEKEQELGDSTKMRHATDVKYDQLKCKLELVDSDSEEFKIIGTYTKETRGWSKFKIMNVWKVDREDEGARFQVHNSIEHRKLLWHGTRPEVVVAILKSGLRIMPYSDGRAGFGISFASENLKSAGHTGVVLHKSQQVGFMFLSEVALGKEYQITNYDSSLLRPPPDFDSIVLKGTTEPDPSKDTKIVIDGKDVIVPQGKPINIGLESKFGQSEYIICEESQCRIRYLLQMKYN